MQVTAEQVEPCTVVLEISVDEQQVARSFDATYREFSRYVNVPGFRPGKAPRALVQKYVNQERVREHARDHLIRDTVWRALEQEELDPLPGHEPAVEPGDLSDHEPFTYKVRVPLRPKIKLGPYTGLTAVRRAVQVNEQMVDGAINSMRADNSRLERVADRGVEPGDLLIADTQIAEEGDVQPPGPARRQLIQLGETLPGFDEAVLGMQRGDERTFTLTYPDDYEDEEKRGKQVTFTVRLSSINRKVLPELNEDFARDRGADSLEDLRNSVRAYMQRDLDEAADRQAEESLLQQILASSEIDFPEALVADELRDLLVEHDRRLRRGGGGGLSEYLKATNTSGEQMAETLKPEAERRVRVQLVLQQMSVEQSLMPTREDVDAQFQAMSQSGAIPEETMEEYARDAGRRAEMANAILQRRIHDYLFANNSIQTEVVNLPSGPAEEQAADAAEEEAG